MSRVLTLVLPGQDQPPRLRHELRADPRRVSFEVHLAPTCVSA